LLDVNEKVGKQVEQELGPNAHFHKTDVTSYPSLSGVFEAVHQAEKRLDFVFANAGIVEKWNFYAKHDTYPPPEPDQLVIDINLKAVISTSYLALHYFRLSPSDNKSLVMTASTGALYKAPFCSMYTGSKHGTLGFMRSIAGPYYAQDGIRVNATCPSAVQTNLLDAQGWSAFPKEYFTPMSAVVDTVLMLIDGGDWVDTKGVKVPKGKDWGVAVEISQNNQYFRDVGCCEGR